MEGFLTAEQREAFNKAVQEKEKEARIAAQQQKTAGSGNHERKPRSGRSGATKKSGAGGRFTWGKPLDVVEVGSALDKNDPNYDSDEERQIVLRNAQNRLREEVQSYKAQVKSIVEEYFESGDIADVAESLDDLGTPTFLHYFVKRLITLALDRNNREREMASQLLSALYAEVLPSEQVEKGFVSLVDSVGDLVLDVPDVPDLLGAFIARAVVDDVLAPAIINRIPADYTPAATCLKHKVENLLSERHSAEKVLRCWGSGAGLTYDDTKASIARLLDEFSSSADVDEAARCLRGLKVPFFHHELVKQAVQRAMEATDSSQKSLVGLLARLCESGEISGAQLSKGLKRVADGLDDLVLDRPGAREKHGAVMQLLKEAGLMELEDGRPLSAAASTNSINGLAAASVNGSALPSGGVASFKAAARAAIVEYFSSADVEEVGRRLLELDQPGLLHLAVKIAVTMALDRKDREREAVSKLLCGLHPQVIDGEAMALGFTRLLGSLDDLVLDCPDAVHMTALFTGRAVVDEVLPPAFLTQVLHSLRPGSLGIASIKAAGAALSARHSAERLINCWHGGALALEQVKALISSLLAEYLTTRDAGEAARCLSELDVPHYHHEVVVAAIETAFDKEQAVDDLITLLAYLASTGGITATQMSKGFSRVKSVLHEETLDFGAHAKAIFARMVEAGTAAGWLTVDPEA